MLSSWLLPGLHSKLLQQTGAILQAFPASLIPITLARLINKVDLTGLVCQRVALTAMVASASAASHAKTPSNPMPRDL